MHGDTLRSLEKDFDVLRDRRFLTVDFNERSVSTAIKNIFSEIESIPYIGGHTSTPKIMHLLNPEIFVMWDKDIRETYKDRNSRITDSPRGYLEFLKETQKELKKLFRDRQNETGKGSDEVEKEIRVKFRNKTLARITYYGKPHIRSQYIMKELKTLFDIIPFLPVAKTQEPLPQELLVDMI